MVDFVIVVEGGGTGPNLKGEMAQGFRKLFDKISPRTRKPKLIRGGGRTQALDKFVTAWASRKPGDVVVLLIDSEEGVTFGNSKIDHLVNRDHWKAKPADLREDNVFLMVCVMEAWICTDRDALKHFYDGGFDEAALPDVKTLEKVDRGRLYDCLEKATKGSKRKSRYSKGGHSFELMGLLDPNRLEVLPHAKQFIAAYRECVI